MQVRGIVGTVLRNSRLTPDGGRGLRRGILTALALALAVLGVDTVAPAVAAAPVVTANPAGNVAYTTALASGEINPEDHETSYHFEYATQAQYESCEWCEASRAGYGSLAEGAGATPVEAQLEGLRPGTVYHLRLVAANESGEETAVAPNFETEPVAKPTVSLDPVSTFTATTATFIGHVNPNAPAAAPGQDPAFETTWEFTCEPFECPELEGGRIEAGNSAETVEINATRLHPNTEYTVILHAKNAGGEETAAVAFITAGAPPTALTGVNVPTADGGLDIFGYVNPRNRELQECLFEYGLTETYGQTQKCGGEEPSGDEATMVSMHLGSVEHGALYHFRIKVTTAAGTTESEDGIFALGSAGPDPSGSCPNEALRSQRGETFLGDCRAWEMVSPPEKNGGQLTLGADSVRAAAAGGSVLFDSKVAFGDAKGTGSIGAVTYRADRGGSSWATRALMPPQEVNPLASFTAPGYPVFTPDLSHGLLTANDPPLTPEAQPGFPNLYLTDGYGGSPRLVDVTQLPLHNSPFNRAIGLALTRDATHALFSVGGNLTSDSPEQGPFCASFGFCETRLYEWEGGTVRYFGVLPGGVSTTDLALGNNGENPHEAMSEDGRRIYFSSPTNEESRLYLRKDGGASVVWVSESETSAPEPTEAASFWGMSADGSRAVFTTAERLVDDDQNPTSDSNPGTGGTGARGPGVDLYLYRDGPETETESNLTLLSRDFEPSDGTPGSAAGVLGMSTDAHRVYFATNEIRSTEKGQQIVAGGPTGPGRKLYLWENGKVTYITSLDTEAEADEVNWSQAFNLKADVTRVSPSGRFVVFRSDAPQPGASGNGGVPEEYRYDAVNHQLLCISCDRSGRPSAGAARLGAEWEGLSRGYRYTPRALSMDGSRVFFNTTASLLPEDSNGRADAYEWEEDGHGTCSEARGCLTLLSSGEAGRNSYFVDADVEGDEAFIVTQQALSNWDGGESDMDLYDVHVDGGLPERPVPPPGCEGDACQPPPVRLDDPTPSSASFAGPGNRRRRLKHHSRHHRKHHRHLRGRTGPARGNR